MTIAPLYSPGTKLFAVAPMIDWTDRHCRYFHRQLTRRALLYTEMVVADAIIHGHRDRLLGFSPEEHPVALQLGGSDPAKLSEAVRIAADYGYDEINLNVGCPSDRVQSGTFGACLMREPETVAACVAAMKKVASVPVTVKCRIGVDDQDPEEALFTLVDRSAAAGIEGFVVHARKAWLKGLSPKENRDIPPLDYALVWRLKRERPELTIVINGGVEIGQIAVLAVVVPLLFSLRRFPSYERRVVPIASVVVALIAAVAAWAVLHDGEGRGRLAAIDACTHKGGKAVVSRDGWWCEMPGALP